MSLEHHTRGPHKIRTGSEHTLLHRASWKPDERGRIVATLDDYTVVRDLVADLISEGVEVTVPPIVREAVEAVEKLIEVDDEPSVTISRSAPNWVWSNQPAYRRVQMALDAEYLKNLENRRGRPARLVIGDPLPEVRDVLPEPEIFTHPKCSEGGVYPLSRCTLVRRR